MKYTSYKPMNCSLAQTLAVIGDRWTLLILRDIFFGQKRFAQLQRNLGIAKNILAARLKQLMEEGIVEKRESESGAHAEYVLTPAGLELQPVLLAMTHWGDKHRPNPKGERVTFIERETGKPIRRMGVVSEDGRPLRAREVRAIPGPGAD